MKRTPFFMLIILTFAAQVAVLAGLLGRMNQIKRDPVAVNECMYSVAENFGNDAMYSNALMYSILDTEGAFVYENAQGMSHSINDAIKNNDLILDINVDGAVVGKLLLYNPLPKQTIEYRQKIIVSMAAFIFIQGCIVVAYFLFLKKRIIVPFRKLKGFASRVAAGNLELPLEIDKNHVFGEFTEAFDLMRSELKKARVAEKKANDDKKEVIAKLSHDIKTPVASIKSTSEIGFEVTKEERTREFFNRINVKSDQITTLVDNLFSASIQDATELEVSPGRYSFDILPEMLKAADYLNKASVSYGDIPACDIFCDKLRLQQAFDNIFMNSYKYGQTDIEVNIGLENEYLVISIADKGPGVADEELALLKEKYKRGSNTEGKDGAGLGLYITGYFMDRMEGLMKLRNNHPGFEVLLYLRRI